MMIACVQYDIAWENPYANYGAVRSMLGNANLPPGSLVLLPEMFSTGFSMNVDAIDDSPKQETQQFIADLACRLGLYLVAGVVTRAADGRGQNQAVVCDPSGAIICRYQKMHPFRFAGESDHFNAGDKLVCFAWGEFQVCPLVCYDLRFPEIFRAGLRAGANLFVVLANWPSAREGHWLSLLQARAIENQAYVAAVNRVGADPQNQYSGRSLIIDPKGTIVADAGSVPGVISANADFLAMQEYRGSFPALADIRDDLMKTTVDRQMPLTGRADRC